MADDIGQWLEGLGLGQYAQCLTSAPTQITSALLPISDMPWTNFRIAHEHIGCASAFDIRTVTLWVGG
jgi:hypothetical protein